MTRILLDTHIWVWRLLEPERLSRPLDKTLSDPHNELCLSPVSVWETLVLARKGRLRLQPDPKQWVIQALRSSNLTALPLTHEIAIMSERLTSFGFKSSDPADRLLVATALTEGTAMATVDRNMRDFERLECVW